MSDQEFLTNYIEFLEIAKKKYGYQALLDVNFKFVFVSNSVAMCFKDTTEEQLIGMNFVEDIPRPTHIIDKKREIFTRVIKNREPVVYLATTSNSSQVFRKLIICAMPIINPGTSNVVGIELTGGATIQDLIQSDKEKGLFNNNELVQCFKSFLADLR